MTDRRSVLQSILETAGLGNAAFATALGIGQQVFEEMLAGQRPIPDSMVSLISAVAGVQESALMPNRLHTKVDVPAIWYKLRAAKISEADKEYVLAFRQLAYYQHELEAVTNCKATAWKEMFVEFRRQIDPQASPAEQGRQAARLFRKMSCLDQGSRGVGEVFRGYLRTIGVLVVESPAPDSVLDGCSFYVGPAGAERPALFANAYRTTWFRRNRILMHELAHAIFDVESGIATLDLSTGQEEGIIEARADAFAQEALVPKEVLRNLGQRRGVDWTAPTPNAIANLIADSHVEQRLLAAALLESELVNAEIAELIEGLHITDELKEISEHALSTKEYLQASGIDEAWVTSRHTTTAPRKMLLSMRYVSDVLNALKSQYISLGKAARMLMIDEHDFRSRFGPEYSSNLD